MLKRFFASLSLILLLCTAVPATGYASWNPFGKVYCGGTAKDSAICVDRKKTDNPLTGTNGLILKIADIVAVIAGIAAVIMLIVSGLRFIQAGGNAEAVAGARRGLLYALVGIVVIMLSRAIIGFVLSKVS